MSMNKAPLMKIRVLGHDGISMLSSKLPDRSIVGSFHKVSRKYMPLYIAEFQFRYNNRENADIFGAAIRGC